jgi:hypothetical protein
MEVKPSQLSPWLPSKSMCSPYPNAPASFMGSPKLETTTQDLSLPSSSPKPARTASPRSLLVPTAAAYKRPPFLAEKTHTTHRTSPDILLSILALSIELAGASGAPRAPHIPGVSEALPTRRLLEPAERIRRRRQDASPPPVASPVSHLEPRLLPVSRSLLQSGWGRRPPRYRFGHKP